MDNLFCLRGNLLRVLILVLMENALRELVAEMGAAMLLQS